MSASSSSDFTSYIDSTHLLPLFKQILTQLAEQQQLTTDESTVDLPDKSDFAIDFAIRFLQQVKKVRKRAKRDSWEKQQENQQQEQQLQQQQGKQQQEKQQQEQQKQQHLK